MSNVATVAESVIRILIVDDDVAWAHSLGAALHRQYGADVAYENSLEGAAARLRERQYDVVVVDIWFGDQDKRGDQWLLANKSLLGRALKVLFTADETRGGNWHALRESRIVPLRKLTDESRFKRMVRDLAERLDRQTGESKKVDFIFRATPEETASLFGESWLVGEEWERLLSQGDVEPHVASSSQVIDHDSYLEHRRSKPVWIAIILLLELPLGTAGITWILGLSLWIGLLTYAVLGVSIAIWFLALWSKHSDYRFLPRAAVMLASFILLAELILLVSGLTAGRRV